MKTLSIGIEVVDIRKMTGDSKVKAMADVKFGECLIVKGFSVVEGKNGIFVSMPRRSTKDGNWFDIMTPLNEEFKAELQDKVLEAYDRETDGVKA